MKPRIELADILILIGMGSLGYGLWTLWPWLSFIVLGAILVAFGTLSYMRR